MRQRAHEFDVLHFHIEPLFHFPLFRGIRDRTVTTLHGRLDAPDLQPLLREFRDMPVVSISDSQRAPAPGMNWLASVYHGLAADIGPCNPAPRGRYLAFLGRVSPEKGLDNALVFPIDWPEPLGLAMIEAMSCGTPVPAAARRRRRSRSDALIFGAR